MLLKFTTAGKFLQQIGRRNASTGNQDTKNLKEPADLVIYRKTNEAFVADGYGNRRVIVLDADTGTFKRMWAPSEMFRSMQPPHHCGLDLQVSRNLGPKHHHRPPVRRPPRRQPGRR